MSFADRLTFKNRVLEYFMVTAIIVLVVTVSFVFLNAILAQARDTERIGDISALRNALELYYLDHGAYSKSEWTNSTASSWDALGQVLRPYISAMPRDPINEPNHSSGEMNTFSYSYYSGQEQTTGGKHDDYVITFRLEKPEYTPDYQQADVGLVTAEGRVTFLPLARAEDIYLIRAPQ